MQSFVEQDRASSKQPAPSDRQRSLADELRSAPFEMVLSSGFFGFFAHTGVMAALEELQLRPSLLGGSSAGALISGMWAAGLSAAQVRDELFSLTRESFWDPDRFFGVRYYAAQLQALRGKSFDAADGVGSGLGLLRGEAFDALLQAALDKVGVRTFAQCQIPVRVAAFHLRKLRTVVLSEGELAPAIRASCSFPGMFQPTVIGSDRYLDGGIADRPGLSTATPGVRLLFHHLPAKSPWRKVVRVQNHPPARPNMFLLHEPSLPQLSPFHLDRGPYAYELARAMALRTLNAPAKLYQGEP